jgi:sterol desaturase/sphingolipid hydroxylase (fatty acid hydroxylase superfamily)
MHIWHHSKELPRGSYGVNYGITLSVWDYLFGTVWMPGDGRDIKLGFEEVDEYPHSFFGQVAKPFSQQ